MVYNEMRGAFADADELEENAIMRALYPDTPYRFRPRRRPRAHPRSSRHEKFPDFHSARLLLPVERLQIFPGGGVVIDARARQPAWTGNISASAEPGRRLHRAGDCKGSVRAPEQRKSPYELPAEGSRRERRRLAWGRVAAEITDRERPTAMQLLCTVLCGSNQSVLTRGLLAVQDLGREAVSMMFRGPGCAQPFAIKLEIRNLSEDKLRPRRGEKRARRAWRTWPKTALTARS
ncbi:MAG: hypothetical protein ACLTSG_09955 [Lachnospiraceae bacterium]